VGVLFASDIHGSVEAASGLLDIIERRAPKMVVLLGDLLYHGPRNKLPGTYDGPETARLLSSIGIPVIALKGNCDAEVDQLMVPWPLVDSSYVDLDGQVFLACHGHQLSINGGSWQLSFDVNIVCGHTHIPEALQTNGFHRWNPGSLGIPKGGYPPSYGWYDELCFRVCCLHDGQVIMQDRCQQMPEGQGRF
jgi:putative phosphoesterase